MATVRYRNAGLKGHIISIARRQLIMFLEKLHPQRNPEKEMLRNGLSSNWPTVKSGYQNLDMKRDRAAPLVPSINVLMRRKNVSDQQNL
jgi:hypothetical protein